MMRALVGAMTCAVALTCATPAFAAGRQVTLLAHDGTQLAATLYEPSSRPAPAVVLVHMLGRSKEDWDRFAQSLEDAGIIALAIDLRGHGRSSGSNASLAAMVLDVTSAVGWIAARPTTRPGAVAVVGASLGATLTVLAAGDSPSIRAIGLISPSGDYRGLRIDTAAMKKIGDRPVWMAASAQDSYALRTMRELASASAARDQRVSNAPAHGTNLLGADGELSRALVDWLRRTLIF